MHIHTASVSSQTAEEAFVTASGSALLVSAPMGQPPFMTKCVFAAYWAAGASSLFRAIPQVAASPLAQLYGNSALFAH